MSILSDRTDKARLADASILFLVSVALVAAVSIVLFSVASISLLRAGKETLTLFQGHNSHFEDKVIGAIDSHMDGCASPVPAQAKFPTASNVDNMSSSTPVPRSSGMLTDETLAAPALKPTPDREAIATAVGSSNGSTRAPSTDQTLPPVLSPSQQVGASPASIADATNPAQDAQIRESTGFYGFSAGPESKPSVPHAAPHGRGAVKADNIANKLNHAELSRLMQRSRVLR
jgi:hypothetical protein